MGVTHEVKVTNNFIVDFRCYYKEVNGKEVPVIDFITEDGIVRPGEEIVSTILFPKSILVYLKEPGPVYIIKDVYWSKSKLGKASKAILEKYAEATVTCSGPYAKLTDDWNNNQA